MRRPASAALPFAALVGLAACGGSPPDTLGARDGVLAPCPAQADCVHTGLRHPDGTRGLFVKGSLIRQEVIGQIREVVEEMPGATVVTADENYLHVEFRSRYLGFVDDLEILLDPAREAIVRSASRRRIGGSGGNVERVAELRRRLDEAGILR